MAAIDHTVIVYKNGEYLKNPDTYDENGDFINLCPFDYSRDGEITAVYEREGIDGAPLFPITWWKLVKILQWKLHIMR